MAYGITSPRVGFQPIANTETVAKHQLGTRVWANDPIYGEGEFIYLKGVASTVVGSMVVWDGASAGTPTYQTALCPSTANLAQSVAFAMSANVAAQFGWYQVSGSVVASTNGTLAAGPGPVYVSATAGQITSAAVAGKQVLSARNSTATGTPATNQAVIVVERPSMQGAIT